MSEYPDCWACESQRIVIGEKEDGRQGTMPCPMCTRRVNCVICQREIFPIQGSAASDKDEWICDPDKTGRKCP